MKKIILFFLAILLVIGVWALFFRKGGATQSLSNNQLTAREVQSFSDHFNKKIPFNVLLLGYGGGNHDGTYLTDSMMVAHVDPGTKVVTLISIPRDIWVKVPTKGNEGGYWKINAAYALGLDNKRYPQKAPEFQGVGGGGNLAKYAVEQVTGLPIDRYVALDFNGFKKTIDFLGGVDVKVEKVFDDFEYPISGKETDLCGKTTEELPDLEKIATVSASQAFPCRYEHIHFDAGIIHMDGDTALKFVRSRHSLQDGNDFGRSTRQRNVILAVKQKVMSLGFIPKIPGFVSTLRGSLSTDIGALDIKDLLPQAPSADSYEIKSLALTTDNFLKVSFSADGQYILVSKDGIDDWSSVHAGITAFLNPESRTTSPLIQVANGTNIAGLYEAASSRLKESGFVTVSSGVYTGEKGLEKTFITVFNSSINTKILRQIQNVLETSNLVYNKADGETYDILVTLGNDFKALESKKVVNQ